jgi:hypothetical protein
LKFDPVVSFNCSAENSARKVFENVLGTLCQKVLKQRRPADCEISMILEIDNERKKRNGTTELKEAFVRTVGLSREGASCYSYKIC